MDTVVGSKRVLHRGRAAVDSEEAEQSREEAEKRVSAQAREQMIALAAYYRAQRRNFDPGHELEDWLEAEAEVNARLEVR